MSAMFTVLVSLRCDMKLHEYNIHYINVTHKLFACVYLCLTPENTVTM